MTNGLLSINVFHKEPLQLTYTVLVTQKKYIYMSVLCIEEKNDSTNLLKSKNLLLQCTFNLVF
jgi:hypothetical protein